MCFNIEHIIQHSDSLLIRYNNILPSLLSSKEKLQFEFPTYYFVSGFSHPILPIITSNGMQFFEWRDFNKTKYPYLIQLKDEEIFSVGCIYDTWIDHSTGEVRNTFSIITTKANAFMEKIHNLKNRMPLIISKDDELKWIDKNLNVQNIQSRIKPYDEAKMRAYTISIDANNTRFDSNQPQIIDNVVYNELPN